MTTPSNTLSFEPVGNSRARLQRILGIMGVTVLVIVAIIEVVPFILTIANSFKCDPAITSAPGAFIPLPPFGVAC